MADDGDPGAPDDTDAGGEWANEVGRRPAGDDARGVTLDGEGDDEETFWAAYGRAEAERNPEATLARPDAASTTLENISRADLREHYGPIRTLFKQREASYTSFQRQLTQAWVSQTYDQYLATLVARMLYIVGAGVLLAAAVGGGVLGAARYGALPRVVPVVGLPAGTAAGLAAGLSVAGGVGCAALYWAWRRVGRIRTRIARRRREINYNLPYAITFMYALARAGVNFDRIVARLADSTDAYGAVGQEFDRVVRNQEMFGNNLYVGLQNLRAVTPSEELRRLADDLVTVLETGGDLAGFLRDEVDAALETAIAEQESFIERLELLSEVFVVGFVAAPLFVLVVLIVVSFLGADTLGVIALLTYAVIPLALLGFVVLVDAVNQPFVEREVSFTTGRDPPSAPPAAPDDPEWRGAYERTRRLTGIRDRLRDQVVRTRDEPWRALLFSVPLGVALPVAGVLTGEVPFAVDALLARPVEVTTELAVVPVVVAATTVALVYEYRERQERAVKRRFPDLLELLAASNRRGLSLSRALDIVADSASGRLGDELRLLRNDVRWNADLPGAFEAFGDRLSSPALTRTVNLVAEGSRVTSDLHVVLEIAATDTAERVRLERDRRQTLQSYLVIVVIGFLVYLLVVLLLAANFLDPLEAFAAGGTADGAGLATAGTAPVSLGAVPVDQLRVLLFHSALIQGFGSGVLGGKLAENSLYSGLKYGVGLTLVAVVAFAVV
ncbi:MAG: type II secretion system F family protein [Halobacteriaceae archaeon]